MLDIRFDDDELQVETTVIADRRRSLSTRSKPRYWADALDGPQQGTVNWTRSCYDFQGGSTGLLMEYTIPKQVLPSTKSWQILDQHTVLWHNHDIVGLWNIAPSSTTTIAGLLSKVIEVISIYLLNSAKPWHSSALPNFLYNLITGKIFGGNLSTQTIWTTFCQIHSKYLASLTDKTPSCLRCL